MLYLFLLLITADQATKLSAVVLASNTNINIVHNTGIAFGMLGNNSSLVIFITSFLLCLLFLFRNTFFLNNYYHHKAFILILSGGAGNLLDRMLYGHVIDFIKVPFIPYFNLADVFINIGMLLYLIGVLKKNAPDLQ